MPAGLLHSHAIIVAQTCTCQVGNGVVGADCRMATMVAAPTEKGMTSSHTTARLPLLDPAAEYDPNTFDYNSTTPGQPGRAQWIKVFR